MEQQFMKTAFFDFDGVIVDTEPIYDIYWNEAGERYQTGISNFASHIKGTTLPYILDKYFSDRSEQFKEMVTRESMEFEQEMPFPPGFRWQRKQKHYITINFWFATAPSGM